MASPGSELSVPSGIRRVILVGKTGSGKSTLGNLLLDRPDVFPPEEDGEQVSTTAVTAQPMTDSFVVGTGFDAETKRSDYRQSTAWGRNLKVVDTPGLFDPSENLTITLDKVTSSLSLISPGPHAVLFVTRCDIRFTDEEKNTFDEIIRVFGESVRPHIIVVFSRGDTLGQRDIGKLLAKAPEMLKQIMQVVGDNYAVVSRTGDSGKRRQEVEKLLTMIDGVSSTGHFTRPELASLDREIEAAVERAMNDYNIRRDVAEVVVRRGIAQGDQRFHELSQRLRLITVGSLVFGLAAGLAGSAMALGLVEVGALELIGLSGVTAEQITAAVTAALAHLQDYLLYRAQTGRPCVVM